MKKIYLIIAIMLICLTGCGKMNLEDAVTKFTKTVESSKSYKLNGTMEIKNDEETFIYNIDTYFLKDDYYKVILVNQTNNHEQVILKNNDGLYVVTPSLNKSFKFDSVWPENSSQAYILQNLINDVQNDPKKELEETDNGYIIKSTVNYPNNEELTYQKIYFDKDMNINKVEVFNENDIIKIKVTFKTVDLKAKLSEDDFVLEDLIDTSLEEQNCNESCTEENCNNNCEDSTTSSTLDSIIYPLYIPANTHLSASENVTTEEGERVILTFAGDKNFVIVEETTNIPSEFEIVPIFGDPLMLDETIAAMSSNSISWSSDTISYYLISSDLSTTEMINIAKSLSNTKTVISIK